MSKKVPTVCLLKALMQAYDVASEVRIATKSRISNHEPFLTWMTELFLEIQASIALLLHAMKIHRDMKFLSTNSVDSFFLASLNL